MIRIFFKRENRVFPCGNEKKIFFSGGRAAFRLRRAPTSLLWLARAGTGDHFRQGEFSQILTLKPSISFFCGPPGDPVTFFLRNRLHFVDEKGKKEGKNKKNRFFFEKLRFFHLTFAFRVPILSADEAKLCSPGVKTHTKKILNRRKR